jgi:hypothetical protein
MKKIIIDRKTLAKLKHLEEKAEFCDESGVTLGYFKPTDDRDIYKNTKVPKLSRKELKEIEREMNEGRFFTTAQVLAHLRSLEKR